jgi:hypothetical protein
MVTLAMVMWVSTIVTKKTCQPEKFKRPLLNQFKVASSQAHWGNNMSETFNSME